MKRFAFKASAAAVQLRDYQQDCVDALVHEVTSPGCTTKNLVCSVAMGGGKRLIAAEFLRRYALPKKRRVLVVTALGWRLLAQQAETFCQRERDGSRMVSFIGGRHAEQEFVGIRRSAEAPIVFCTYQTWAKRQHTDFKEEAFDIIVIDELHHGEEGLHFRALLDGYPKAVVVGFTGTPRNWSDFKRIGNVNFASLINRGFLAKPIVHPPIRTGVHWTPQRSSAHSDVAMRSLVELGASDERNRLIVSTYLAGRKEYGQTLVFCCDISHAEVLHAMFAVSGVKSGVVHSQQTSELQLRNRRAFERGELDVMTNVGMLTTGVDIPQLQTIFLARPTTSEVLFAQMIGRGARLAPGKATFGVVDFVDAVPEDGLDLVRPDGFLGTGRPLRCPLIERHEFEPAELEVIPGAPGYEALEGLEIVSGQTFGIEFEATGRDRAGNVVVPYSMRGAQQILDALRKAGFPTATRPLEKHSCLGTPKDNELWNCEPDPSAGWEVTSRILRGRDGMGEIVDACRVLSKLFDELGLTVDDRRVGTHIHLGWTEDLTALQQLTVLGAFFEPAIFSLVAPSRARNVYVQSMRNRSKRLLSFTTIEEWKAYFDNNRRKHLAINPGHLLVDGGYGSIEVRHHSGTIEAPKILAWISLWMRILATARQENALPGSPYARPRTLPLCRGDRGDVARMCDRLGVGPGLRARLLARRDEVVSRWWAQDERFSALAIALLQQWEGYDAPVASAPGAQAAE